MWGDVLSLVLICFSIVLVIMGLFVGLLSIFKLLKKKTVAVPHKSEELTELELVEKNVTKISDTEYAVIATAIHLYFNNNHDDEPNVLTIKNISQNYSPWRLK
jgi:hypothetical protein